LPESFLSLWSHANPRGKPGKELCDILVVCGPDVIIFSVKAIDVSSAKDPVVALLRWRKKAIEQSASQIYGAERWLQTATHVIRADGCAGLALPPVGHRRIHRVAVALGSKGQSPVEFGDFGKGFVHVFDELSFSILLRELDTIADFVGFLRAKEDLVGRSSLDFQGSEEDLLAYYLHSGRNFPETHSGIIVGDGLWRKFQEKNEVKAKKKADKESYFWDGLIEVFAKDVLGGNLEFSSSPENFERALRVMAREDRFSRRIMGRAFREFLDQSSSGKVRARMLKSSSGVVYVFLALPRDSDRQLRMMDLANRCFVARGLQPESKTVIGIATEQYEPGKEFSLDLSYLYVEDWTQDNQKAMEDMRRDLGYFANPEKTEGFEDEYPGTVSVSESAS
jgi:hypothetical protein